MRGLYRQHNVGVAISIMLLFFVVPLLVGMTIEPRFLLRSEGDLFFLCSNSEQRFYNELDSIGPAGYLFPFAYIVLQPVFFLADLLGAKVAVFAFQVMSVILLVFLVRKNVPRGAIGFAAALVISCFSLPFFELIATEGVEWILFFPLFAFLKSFQNRRYFVAAALLAVAASIKGYPLVFLSLFLSRVLYREALVFGVLWVFLTMLGVGFRQEALSESFVFLRTNQLTYLNWYLANSHLQGVGLFDLIISLDSFFQGGLDRVAFFSVYYKFAALCFFIICGYFILFDFSVFRIATALTSALCLFPVGVGGDRLILFIPLFLMSLKSKAIGLNRFFIILFSMLLSPRIFQFSQDFSLSFLSRIFDVLLLSVLLAAVLLQSAYHKFFKTSPAAKKLPEVSQPPAIETTSP